MTTDNRAAEITIHEATKVHYAMTPQARKRTSMDNVVDVLQAIRSQSAQDNRPAATREQRTGSTQLLPQDPGERVNEGSNPSGSASSQSAQEPVAFNVCVPSERIIKSLDPRELEPYFSSWMLKLTQDHLHSKGDIAAALAYMSKQVSYSAHPVTTTAEQGEKVSDGDWHEAMAEVSNLRDDLSNRDATITTLRNALKKVFDGLMCTDSIPRSGMCLHCEARAALAASEQGES